MVAAAQRSSRPVLALDCVEGAGDLFAYERRVLFAAIEPPERGGACHALASRWRHSRELTA